MNKIKLIIGLMLISVSVFAQKTVPYKKGTAYFTWGWNRAAYTNSTLKIQGADYNLTLNKLVAHDRPTPFSVDDYFAPDKITIPQTNMRLGYFIKDNLAVVAAVDHMKYVMDQDQTANVQGTISRAGKYKGTYNGNTVLTEDFFTFEHTDGLNYVNVGVEKYHNLYNSQNGKVNISALYGGNVGVLVPKTNVQFLDYERTDRFHLSGFGLEAKAGVQAKFWNHLLLRTEVATGYINMPNVILHKTGVEGKGKQQFAFAEWTINIGYCFNWKK